MSDVLSAGRLEDHPFAELSGLLFQESRTGELNLASGGRRRTVWFLGGNPVAVVSEDPQDHLAQFLLEHGKIDADDARRLAGLPETREALGTTDFLAKETLNWGVKSRFVNLCYDLFRWEDGDYAFHDGEPPRELFLLKVPSHSLIFKGVGFMGQAAVVDAVPDDAVCGVGPVAQADARYLSPDALRFLDRCRPGATVAEALGTSPADGDQARRLLYALQCLGLVSLGRAPVPGPVDASLEVESSGFVLDDGSESGYGDGPPLASLETGESPEPSRFPFEDESPNSDFSLNFPPIDSSPGPLSAPDSPFDSAGAAAGPGGYPFEDELGAGAFGTFNQDAGGESPGEAPPAAEEVFEETPAKVKPKPSGSRFRVPRLAGVALGSLAALGLIGAAAWWWMSGSEPAPPPVQPPVNRPAGTPSPAPAAVPATPSVVPPPAPTAAPVAPAAVPPAPAATAPPPSTAPVTPPPSATAPAAPAARAASGQPAPGANASDRYRTALEVFNAGDLDGAAAIWEALLAEQHRSAFTVQLLTACQAETLRAAQRTLPANEMYLVGKKVNGRACYRICLGTHDSREAAGRALAGLPAQYRSGGATVRQVADVLDRDR